jgi:hypothetical protein
MRSFATRAGYRIRPSQNGSQIAEFGAAVVFLATIILIPLVDLVIVPIRWMMAQDAVNSYARKYALCETLNQSWRMMQSEPSLSTRLNSLGGVTVESTDMHLKVSPIAPGSGVLLVDVPGQVPSEWLPDGVKAPCVYALELTVNMTIAPAILFRSSGKPVPGLTAPFPVVMTASHEWENLGRNPSTGEYYLNE